MIIDNIKDLLIWICITLFLLGVCVAVDSATTIVAMNDSLEVPNGTIMVNESHYSGETIVMDSNDKIHTVKSKKKKKSLPTVSMWARPSVCCGLSYKWYYRSFVDYCPHCHRYNVLYDAHKPQAKYEHEWTCKHCGADYDAVVGKEKYDWSNYYLTRA